MSKVLGAIRPVFKALWICCSWLLWKLPKRLVDAYHGIRSPKAKTAIALSILAAVAAGAFWVVQVIQGGFSTDPRRVMASEPGKEICEFLARPAAKLYIDKKLVENEIPPIFRTQLSVGEHELRFVSPDDQTRDLTIKVVKGRPTQWFMNFIRDRVDERPLSMGNESK